MDENREFSENTNPESTENETQQTAENPETEVSGVAESPAEEVGAAESPREEPLQPQNPTAEETRKLGDELITCNTCGLMFRNDIEICPRCGNSPTAQKVNTYSAPSAANVGGNRPFVRPYANQVPYGNAYKKESGSVFTKWWFWLIIGVVVIVAICIIAFTSLIGKAIESGSFDDYEISEVLVDDDSFKVTVTGINTDDSDLYNGFCRITLKFENKTDETLYINPHTMSLNSESVEYLTNAGDYSENNLQNSMIKVGGGKSKSTEFELEYPDNATEFYFDINSFDSSVKNVIATTYSVYDENKEFLYCTETSSFFTSDSGDEYEEDEKEISDVMSDDGVLLVERKRTNNSTDEDTVVLTVTNVSDKNICFKSGMISDRLGNFLNSEGASFTASGILAPGEKQQVSIYLNENCIDANGGVFAEILYGEFTGLKYTYSESSALFSLR